MIRLIATHLLIFGSLCIGCANFPSMELGRLELIAIGGPTPPQSTTLATDIEGEYCQFGDSFDYGAAVDDAIGKVPGANAVANAKFSIRMTSPLSSCTQVRGDAVRMP